jgi:hypothetical protein
LIQASQNLRMGMSEADKHFENEKLQKKLSTGLKAVAEVYYCDKMFLKIEINDYGCRK